MARFFFLSKVLALLNQWLWSVYRKMKRWNFSGRSLPVVNLIELRKQQPMLRLLNNSRPKLSGACYIFSCLVTYVNNPDPIHAEIWFGFCSWSPRATFTGYSGEPDNILNSKSKVRGKAQVDLHTDAGLLACYKAVPFTIFIGICKSIAARDIRWICYVCEIEPSKRFALSVLQM